MPLFAVETQLFSLLNFSNFAYSGKMFVFQAFPSLHILFLAEKPQK
jgi:hypothetical protein